MVIKLFFQLVLVGFFTSPNAFAAGLITSENKSYVLPKGTDQVTIANLFFSSCNGICPLITSKVRVLAEKYSSKRVYFASISVDPEYDTPQILEGYKMKLKLSKPDKWFFITGSEKDIFAVMKEDFHIQNPQKFAHSNNLVLKQGDKIIGQYSLFDENEIKALEEKLNGLLR